MTDSRQAKLNSIDFLLVLMTQLGVYSESRAMLVWSKARRKIFYAHP